MISFVVNLIPTLISAVLFWILLVISEEQKNTYHALLFLTVFFVNLSYFMVNMAHTTDAALQVYKLTYFSGTFLTLFMFMCIAQICNLKIKPLWIAPLILLNTETLVVVFMAGYNKWHYRSVELVQENGISYLVKEYGPHHTVYLVVILLNMLLPIIAIIWAFLHRTQVSWIHAFLLGLAELSTIFIYVIERVIHLKIELLPYAYIMVEISILIIQRRTAIYDVNTNVQLSLAHTAEFGYVLVDTGRRYLGSDAVARKYFPEINSFELDREIKNPEVRKVFGSWMEASANSPVAPKFMERNGRIVKITARPFYRKKGKKHSGYIIQILDDTETQNYIAKLEESKTFAEEMAQKADAANRSKSEFLANISHEIRTPINAVLGFNELVIRESEDDRIRNYAVDIKKAGDTMLNLINDLLDISKIESGKMELIPVSFDLVSMLNDIINVTSVRAQDKGLDLKLEIEPDIPRYLHGDEIRIKQILTNILTNAVKYTNKGTVTLQMSYHKVSDMIIDLMVSVKDTGIGMKPETIEHIFTPYERIDQINNRYIEGTGLGLSITQMLLSLMDSKLDVRSEYGKGSIFSFNINLVVSAEGVVGDLTRSFEELHETLKEYKVSFTAPDAHVLVVDDTKVNIRIFRGLLKRTLVQIDDATSGEEALELTARRQYDAIFIDHMMPGMDGVETLNAIKTSPDNLNRHTPMIMMTANVTSDAKDKYLNLGFDDYIGKPVDPIMLESMLRRVI